MHPVLLEFGSFRIYSYGFMLALSFFVGIQLAARRAGKFGVKKDLLYDLSIILIIGAVVGSRMLYIVTHRDHYHSLLDIISLWQGGATVYGGLILAIAGAVVFLRIKKIPFFKVADITAPSIALGVFITRIGCFLSGCCFGSPTSCPIGMVFPDQSHAGHTFPGAHIHPAQLYASLAGLVIFILLLIIERKRSFDGRTFGFLCILYGLGRFSVDFFRFYEESAVLGGSITISQVQSLVLVAVGVLILIIQSRRSGGGRTEDA